MPFVLCVLRGGSALLQKYGLNGSICHVTASAQDTQQLGGVKTAVGQEISPSSAWTIASHRHSLFAGKKKKRKKKRERERDKQ